MTTPIIADIKVDSEKFAANIHIHYPKLTGNVQEGVDNLEKQLHNLGKDKSIRFLVIHFDDPKLEEGLGLHSYYPEPLDVRVISKWEKIVSYIERLDKITFAVLPPHVNDAVLQVALATDFNYCTAATQFKLSAISSGALPGMAEFRLAKQIGLGKAKTLLFTGQVFDASAAHSLGLVTEVSANPDQAVENMMKDLDSHQALTIQCARRLLTESYSNTYDDEIGDYFAAQTKLINDLKAQQTKELGNAKNLSLFNQAPNPETEQIAASLKKK